MTDTLPTGLETLDGILLGGLRPGELTVITGPTAIGKSTLALNFLRHCTLRLAQPAVLYTLEMPATSVGMRIFSAEARVAMDKLRTGAADDDEHGRIQEASAAWSKSGLVIDDSPVTGDLLTGDPTVEHVRTRTAKLVEHSGLALAVVDYVQLFSLDPESDAIVIRQLKRMAMKLGIPVVAVSQPGHGRMDATFDGATMRDADVIIVIYRDDAVDPDSVRAGEADLIVEKRRTGPTGTATVAFQGHYARFVDMAV